MNKRGVEEEGEKKEDEDEEKRIRRGEATRSIRKNR